MTFSAAFQPYILLQSVYLFFILSNTPPLLSASVTLKQLSCHKTGSLSPPATWLRPTTTWSAHLNLHQKCLGSPSRYKSQASGTCCCSRPKHSGQQCPPPPDLLLSSPPLFQLPRLTAYFHCGLASLPSHMAIFCCLWSLLLSLCAVSASPFLMLPAQPALLTGDRKGILEGSLVLDPVL